MAHYVDGRYVKAPDAPWPDYPGWIARDCGCCGGISWGGSEPIDCNYCDATGMLAIHVASGTVALWPGGPLRGAHEVVA